MSTCRTARALAPTSTATSWIGWTHWRGYVAAELKRHEHLAIVGDFNIAPDDRDVHDPELWRDMVLCSDPERDRLKALLDLGLVDTFRLFDQPEGSCPGGTTGK